MDLVGKLFVMDHIPYPVFKIQAFAMVENAFIGCHIEKFDKLFQ
jgi:hypothetical protein